MTNFEIRTVDLPAFVNQISRQSVGFDQLFDQLNRSFKSSGADQKYPPHNVVQYDESHYAIELAVAGFAEDEVSIELNKNVLTVKGEQLSPEAEITYVHKGISNRDFTRTFPLADHIEVTGAKVRNGILTISLERVVPEEFKPKSIAISYDK
jgi:molecular chaperone IbpA